MTSDQANQMLMSLESIGYTLVDGVAVVMVVAIGFFFYLGYRLMRGR